MLRLSLCGSHGRPNVIRFLKFRLSVAGMHFERHIRAAFEEAAHIARAPGKDVDASQLAARPLGHSRRSGTTAVALQGVSPVDALGS